MTRTQLVRQRDGHRIYAVPSPEILTITMLQSMQMSFAGHSPHSVYLSEEHERHLAQELGVPKGLKLKTVLGLRIERAINLPSPTVCAGFVRGN